ncbi:hypothetical protein REC12_19110 [Desulfosporosinus sp. PR]|uniref:hypothetical protein n=1 Tax=Candidatus Desulfosporosinus nitrosoreducens TaxID=3401928 RepID=UPI0027FC2279|nr:hypothetical protein [Desulfosporosinus sp. PR]MDQ7095703.1 hypothetical protein [Desulfosporosinus sp. PR]
MAEKNILAFFKTSEEAKKAAEQLKGLGVTDIQVDRFSKYPHGSADFVNDPTTGDNLSQAALTLGASSNRDTGVLASADVSASGMSDGGQDSVSGRDMLIAAIVDEAQFDRAIQFVKDNGGLV